MAPTNDIFDRTALKVFRRQAVSCEPYREYLDLVGIDPSDISRADDIPFLPIELFKTHRVYCGAGEPEAIFTSSGTGGSEPSRHHIARMADYTRVYTRGFEIFYGPARKWSIFALLPSYLEREGSSLVCMADGLIRQGREAGRGGGFYLYDHGRLWHDMVADSGPKILLGVSYALLDFAEDFSSHQKSLPPQTIVMETGGMKGRREEMSKLRMHAILKESFGVAEIHSEYGMAELSSQAYSSGQGRFVAPPWMRVCVRNTADPLDVGREGRGGIDIIDLANSYSCAFIQTQDVGRVATDGSFEIEGRLERSDIRGCNLLVQ